MNPSDWTSGLVAHFGNGLSSKLEQTNGGQVIASCGSWQLRKLAPSAGRPKFPLVTSSGQGVEFWLLGELFGRHDLNRLCLEAVSGRGNPGKLNGHFILIGFNMSSRQLTVVTSRFGTVHAYQCFNGNRAAVGTCFPSIAAAASQKQLDWLGLAGFFRMGFFPEDRTFFEDIKILKPASRYVFDYNGELLSQQRYWSWPQTESRFDSREEALEAFGESFLNVMQDMLSEGRLAIPISGGLDSRSVVAAIDPDQIRSGRLWSFSYGYGADSAETSIGRQVATARGLPHARYEIAPYLFDRIAPVVNCVEGFQDITQCRQAAVAGELSRNADSVIAAHWGDVWLDSSGLPLNATSDDEIAGYALKKTWKRGGEWLVENLCAPHLASKDTRGELKDSLVERLSQIPEGHEPDFRLKALKTETWGFRWTLASLRAYQAGVFPRLPFFDTRVTDVLSSIPSSLLENRRLQVEFLKRFAPDLARIRWQTYDADLYSYHRFNSWHLPRRAIKKLTRTLRRQQPIERNWEVQLLGEQGRAGLQKWLLTEGLKLHDLVSRKKVIQLLEDFGRQDRDPDLGYTVSMLLTFSAWLELHG